MEYKVYLPLQDIWDKAVFDKVFDGLSEDQKDEIVWLLNRSFYIGTNIENNP